MSRYCNHRVCERGTEKLVDVVLKDGTEIEEVFVIKGSFFYDYSPEELAEMRRLAIKEHLEMKCSEHNNYVVYYLPLYSRRQRFVG